MIPRCILHGAMARFGVARFVAVGQAGFGEARLGKAGFGAVWQAGQGAVWYGTVRQGRAGRGGHVLKQLEVRNFQSLGHVTILLRPFTVIVGPSSSGKSAFVRALTTLAHNQRGTSFITQGEAGALISAVFDHGTVTLTRSRTSSASDAYVLQPTGLLQTRFTKLGGSTPPEVTAFLGQIADPTALAGQFDSPYLLTQSPAESARTLASLTNASLVLEAARESNRRKLESSSTLRLRSQDLTAVTEQISRYPDHSSQQAALSRAEPLISRAEAQHSRLAHLQGLLDSIDAMAFGVKNLRQQLQQQPAAPDLAPAAALANKIYLLNGLVSSIKQRISSIKDLKQRLQDLETARDGLEEQRISLLHALGVCPTCLQSTLHL